MQCVWYNLKFGNDENISDFQIIINPLTSGCVKGSKPALDKIYAPDKVLVFADKSTSLYEMHTVNYRKLLAMKVSG